MNTFCENVATDTLHNVDDTGNSVAAAVDAIVRQADVLPPSVIRELVGRLLSHRDATILDLTANRDAHIPESLKASKVVGVGLNEHNLRQNSTLSEHVVQDLGQISSLPFEDDTFDAALCTVYVDFMADPTALFTEVSRILKPGGLLLVIFSNCYVKLWRQSLGEGRLKRVRNAFYASEVFERPRVLMWQQSVDPTADGDGDSTLGYSNDTVFAVYAETSTVTDPTESGEDQMSTRYPYSDEEIGKRKLQVKDTLRCPYCDDRLKKLLVVQTPFTEWPSEFLYVCLNDECGYFVGGWETLAEQEVPGSYRFMFEPTIGGCYSIPVLSKNDLRDRIVD